MARSAVFGLALCACGAPAAEPVVWEVSGETMGTTFHVRWHGETPATSTEVEAAVSRVLDEVDIALSTWRPDSDLSLARAALGPIVVREETADVVDAALDIARATGGAFDPTVQPLMELWGFRGAKIDAIPSDAAIAAAVGQIDWRRVRVGRDEQGRPTLDDGGTALDVAAIAPGHAVDRISWALSDLGVYDHFVEVGGEIRAHGRAPSGGWWRIGIDLPRPSAVHGQDLAEVVLLSNAALATSGNYRQRYEVGGVVVHHTMDPRTGRPAEGRVLSATVIAPDCRTADGWATALMVLPPDEGMAIVEARPDLEALLLLPDGDGHVRRLSTGMGRHLVAEATKDASPDAGPGTR